MRGVARAGNDETSGEGGVDSTTGQVSGDDPWLSGPDRCGWLTDEASMSPGPRGCLPFMTTQTATLTGISTVAIAVSDQDATKRVFEELGFETRFAAQVNVGFRWIEMGPPGGGSTLSVVGPTDALLPRVDTGITAPT